MKPVTLVTLGALLLLGLLLARLAWVVLGDFWVFVIAWCQP